LIVRPATADDVQQLAEVHTISSRTAYAGIAPPDEGGLERRLRIWAEVLADGTIQPFVADDGGRLLGFASIGPSEKHPGLGELFALYTHPDVWGAGVGQALLEQAHTALAARWDEAVLTVLDANPRARRFYERNGWALSEELVEQHFGGLDVAVCRYRRRFRSSRSPS
jgi:ribosomal protein S18 acetylase RimI-like enzyme